MRQAGFTLVDVLIAVAVVVAGLGAIMACYTGVVGNTAANKLYNQKAYILQDVAERLKVIDNTPEGDYKKDLIESCMQGYTLKNNESDKNEPGKEIKMNFEAEVADKSENDKKKKYNIDLTLEQNEKLDKDKKLISCTIGVQANDNDQHRLEMKTYYYLK